MSAVHVRTGICAYMDAMPLTLEMWSGLPTLLAKQNTEDLFRSSCLLTHVFKVDRLQIILVAKKYISTCRNCSSVGCLKCVQFHNWFRLH